MKKTGTIFTAILFIFALVGGSAIASEMRGEAGEWQVNEKNRASEFIGQTVKDKQGEDLGTVEDLIFDEEGKISYLILAKGGIMGIGADLVPIPYKAEKMSFQEDAVILDMDKQKVEEAPSFSGGEWERFGTKEFRDEVRGYYDMDEERRY